MKNLVNSLVILIKLLLNSLAQFAYLSHGLDHCYGSLAMTS